MIEFLQYAGLALTFASGYIILSYKNYAQERGWPVADLLAVETGIVRLHGSVCLVLPTALAYFAFHWWSPLTVIFLGLFLAYFGVQLLQARVQAAAMVVSISGVLLCMAWAFVMIAEL